MLLPRFCVACGRIPFHPAHYTDTTHSTHVILDDGVGAGDRYEGVIDSPRESSYRHVTPNAEPAPEGSYDSARRTSARFQGSFLHLDVGAGPPGVSRRVRGKPVVLAFYPADWSPVCGDQIAPYSAPRPNGTAWAPR